MRRKTGLAQEVVKLIAHGARFVSLVSARDHDLVAFAVAQAPDIQETGVLPAAALLTVLMEPRHVLLVLDDMEQVVATVATWLLVSCPRLTVLVTRRIALDLTGEQLFQVPPLPVPDPSTKDHPDAYASISLFEQCAQATQSSFVVTEINRGSISEICHRLDGLPLAIELAATRENVSSPADILTRLMDRFTLLTGHHREAPLRLRSLRDVIGWNHELLPNNLRVLHARLAVFVAVPQGSK